MLDQNISLKDLEMLSDHQNKAIVVAPVTSQSINTAEEPHQIQVILRRGSPDNLVVMAVRSMD